MTARLREVDYRHRIRVRWCDTDASGTVHFANYLRYMEETEYAFLRSLGLSVVMHDERGTIGFPRVASQLNILIPARFDEELEIWMQVAGNDGVKLVYRFEIDRAHEMVATGQFDIACCRFPPGELPRAILIPDDFRKRLPPSQP